MDKLTTYERMKRTFEHKEADRIPIMDYPWSSTIERWKKEGMPEDINYIDYFSLDKIADITVDNSPQYEIKILEETEGYKIYTTKWGATMKNWKHKASVPDFVDFKITSPDKWMEAKKRMVLSEDRIPWDKLKKNYKRWRKEGRWIQAHLWFGFDVTHSWAVGTERFLMAMAENPEWCVDMFNHYLDVCIGLLDKVWDAGYEFDSVKWPDDMGYKGTPFFSLDMYRELLKPVQKRAVEWAHKKGVKAHLHSCGYIEPLFNDLVEIGIDALNPIEVKAGMDPVKLKKKYGKMLVFHGGINAVLWDDIEKITEEIKNVIPKMKEGGGYIFASDHSIPSSVSLNNFKEIIRLIKELGSFK